MNDEDIRRRHLIVLATGSYDNDAEWPHLDLAGEIAVWTSWLCDASLERRRFVELAPRLAAEPSFGDVFAALVGTSDVRSSDAVVLIATGHGADIGHAHRLVLRNGDRAKPDTTMVRTDQLVGWLRDTEAEHAFIVIDTCQSGAVSRGMFDFVDELPRGWVGVATSSPRGTARVGAITDAIQAFLYPEPGDERNGSELQPYLSPRALTDALTDAVGDQDIVVFPRYPRDEPSPCLPNPRYRPGQAGQRDPHRRDAARSDEMAAHWGPRARGVLRADEPGWLFTGRTVAMRAVLGAARAEPGAHVITGRAGCGKSAVLSRLVALSDPAFRAAYPDLIAALEASVCPGAGEVSAAVLAKGKTNQDIVEQLCHALGVAVDPGSGESMIAALRAHLAGRRAHPATVVVDAIDEAASPRSLLTEVLAPLCGDWTDPSVRLILGLRSAEGDTGGGHTLSERYVATLAATRYRLDDDTYWAPEDLTAYATQLLVTGTAEHASPYAGRHDLAHRVAAVVARLAQRSYVLAQVAARSLAARDTVQDPDDQAWRDLIGDGLGSVLAEELAASFDDVEDRLRIVCVLQAAALAFGQGVPWRRVWPAMATALAPQDAVLGDADIRSVLMHRLGGYLIRSLEDGQTVYRPFHDALRAALASPAVRRVIGEQIDPADAVAARLHGRILDGLRRVVAPGPDGSPDWTDAPPYVQRHLAAHAAAAGRLSELLRDLGFVLAAEPARLTEVVADARGPVRDPVLTTVLRAAGLRSRPGPAEHRAYLRLAALIDGAGALYDQPARDQRWWPRWLRWSNGNPGALLTSLDTRVVGLGTAPGVRGPVLVAAAQDGEVRCVDAVTGAPRWSVPLGGAIGCAAMSADRAVFVVAVRYGEQDGAVVGLAVEDGTEVWRVPSGDLNVTAVAAITTLAAPVLVIGTYNEGLVSSWDSPGAQICGVVRLWQLSGPPVLAWTRPLFGAGVRQLEIADGSAGRRILAAGDPFGEPVDGARFARVLDLDGHLVAEFPAVRTGVMATATWHGSSGEVAVSTYDAVYRWDPELGTLVSAPNPGSPGCADAIVPLETGEHGYLVLAGWGELSLLDRTTLQRVDQPGAIRASVTCLAAREHGGRPALVTGDMSGAIRSWTVDEFFYAAPADEQAVSVAVDERTDSVFVLVTNAADQRRVRVLDAGTGQQRAEFKTPAAGVECVPAAGLLLLPDGNGVVQARRCGDLGVVWTERVHEDRITDLRAHAGRLVSVGWDHAVRVTDLADGTALCPPTRFPGWEDKGFSRVVLVGTADPLVVAAGTYAGLLGWRLADLLAGEPVRDGLGDHDGDNDVRGRVIAGASSEVTALTWVVSPDRELLVYSDAARQRVHILDLSTGSAVGWDGVGALSAIVQAGPVVWTGDGRGALRAWRLDDIGRTASPTPVLDIRLDSPVRAIHPLAAGDLVVATHAGLVRIAVTL